MMTTINDFASFMAQYPAICDVYKPVAEHTIQNAEQFLASEFPSDYREFLRRWGTVTIAPYEIYGIADEE